MRDGGKDGGEGSNSILDFDGESTVISCEVCDAS